MALDATAILTAATARADALIAAYPSFSPYRTNLIDAFKDDLTFIANFIVANAVVLPGGSPALNAPVGGGAVTGKGIIT